MTPSSSDGDDDPHRSAVFQAAEQHFVGERRLDRLLDDACHRPRAHLLVITVLDEPATRLVGEFDRDIAIGELGLELHDEFVDDLDDDLRGQMLERHNRVETVAEFRREHPIDGLDILAFTLRAGEAIGAARHVGGAGIRRHDQNDVPEIDGLAAVIGELSVIHDLQQNIIEIGMRLFDLVEKQDAMGMLVDRIGEQARPGRSRHSPEARR